jgi:putative heme iron utilization protein
MLAESFGVLSTISVDVEGYPFGSVTPYSMDRMCRPVIYISPIAQHTRNIVADSRVSLTVIDRAASGDVQAQGRVTCLANAIQADDRDASERYFRHFPSSRQYDRTHAFVFYRLEIVRVRFIGGFGQIFWMDPREFSKPNPFSVVDETRIIKHMNQEHAEVLRRLVGSESAEMAGIDADGFDVLIGNTKTRIPFTTPVSNMEDARQAFVEMSRRQK